MQKVKSMPFGPCPLCGARDHGQAAHLEPREAMAQTVRELARVRVAATRVEEWIGIVGRLVAKDTET